MNKMFLLTIACLTILVVGAVVVAQGRRGRIRPSHSSVNRSGVPDWQIEPEFKHDVFTFARVRYTSYGDGYYGRDRWRTDYADADLNFSFRLQELTSLQVDPNGTIVELAEDELLDYPFIYIVEPGRMALSAAEVRGLRRYLENGGFLMVDDFWYPYEWQHFKEEIRRVFPNRPLVKLGLEHDIFHLVYDLDEQPQIPDIGRFWNGGPWGSGEANYQAIFDDQGRMMVIVCHDTDLGDGWEQEGVDPRYFHEMAERWAYPMGINILVYAMTH